MLSRGRWSDGSRRCCACSSAATGRCLLPLIRRPQPALVTALVTILAGLLVFPTLGSQLLPNFKERDFLMHWLTPAGHVRAGGDPRLRLGLQGPAGDPGRSQLRLAHRAGPARRRGLRRRLRRELDQRGPERRLRQDARVGPHDVGALPGLYRDVQTYLRERIKEVLTGSSESIVVRIFGPDLATLREKAAEIEKRVGSVDGVVDAHASLQTDLPHIEVEPDVVAARRHGLAPGDIRRQASTLIASEEVCDIFAGGRAYDVHVTALPSARDSVTDVENLLIDTPSGERVRLKERRGRPARSDAQRHRAGAAVAPHRRRRERRGPRPGRGRRRRRGPDRRGWPSRRSTTRRSSASPRS